MKVLSLSHFFIQLIWNDFVWLLERTFFHSFTEQNRYNKPIEWSPTICYTIQTDDESTASRSIRHLRHQSRTNHSYHSFHPSIHPSFIVIIISIIIVSLFVITFFFVQSLMCIEMLLQCRNDIVFTIMYVCLLLCFRTLINSFTNRLIPLTKRVSVAVAQQLAALPQRRVPPNLRAEQSLPIHWISSKISQKERKTKKRKRKKRERKKKKNNLQKKMKRKFNLMVELFALHSSIHSILCVCVCVCVCVGVGVGVGVGVWVCGCVGVWVCGCGCGCGCVGGCG
jgi:Flp pilus assembly protein TadB